VHAQKIMDGLYHWPAPVCGDCGFYCGVLTTPPTSDQLAAQADSEPKVGGDTSTKEDLLRALELLTEFLSVVELDRPSLGIRLRVDSFLKEFEE
jgi:hypothetical protein